MEMDLLVFVLIAPLIILISGGVSAVFYFKVVRPKNLSTAKDIADAFYDRIEPRALIVRIALSGVAIPWKAHSLQMAQPP